LPISTLNKKSLYTIFFLSNVIKKMLINERLYLFGYIKF